MLQRLAKFLVENDAKVFNYVPSSSENAGNEFVGALNSTYCIFTGIYETKVLAKFQDFEDKNLRALIESGEFSDDVLFAHYVIGIDSLVTYVGAPLELAHS